MNPLAFVVRRPISSAFLMSSLAAGGAVGVSQVRPELIPPKVTSYADYVAVKAMQLKTEINDKLEESAASEHKEGGHKSHHKIVVSTPVRRDVSLTQEYVCQIRSQRHINVCALENGYLQEIMVKEGQAVKKGDLLFKIVPTLYQAKLDAEMAEAQLAQLEYNNTKKLSDDKVVSLNEVKLLEAKLAKAKAKAQLALAELNFTNVVAPFDGIVDRLQQQLGSLIKEGDILTTLSDNSLMWVYFNVPEARYLEYMSNLEENRNADQKIVLVLANGSRFSHIGKIGAIEAKFNNETGNIPFRADFPNPNGLLRHGQTGKVQIERVIREATVIPQRATFEILDKRYVFVVDDNDVVHQREISYQNELDDIFVIKKGVTVKDKIVLEGLRELRDGDRIHFEYRRPEQVIAELKNRAE